MFKSLSRYWLIYLFAIANFTLLLSLLGLSSLKTDSLKEVLFASWGYGWDGMHYIRISQAGYHFPLQAFFPLYPISIKFFNVFLPLTLAYRINLVLILPLLFTLVQLQKLFGITQSRAIRNAGLFLFFPTAFFLQANYTETLFILLSCTMLIFLLRSKFLSASLLGLFLTATKISGLAIVPVILFQFLRYTKNKSWNQNARAFLYSAIPLMGILIYFIYLNFHFGTFWVFFDAQSAFSRSVGLGGLFHFQPYIADLIKNFSQLNNTLPRLVSEIVVFALLALTLVKSFKKMPRALWLYSFFQVLIPLTSGTLLSFNRLGLLAFPLIIYFLNSLNSKKSLFLYISWGVAFQLVLIYLFLNGVFVG